MTRLAVVLGLLAASSPAQERSWRDLCADAERLHGQGQFEQAAEVLAEAVPLAASATSKDRAALQMMLAGALHTVGRTEEAEARVREAVRLAAEDMPPLDETLASLRVALATIAAGSGKLDEAALEACTALEAAEGSSPLVEAQSIAVLAQVSFGRREYETARRLMHLATQRAADAKLPRSDCVNIWLAYAALAVETGAYVDAEKLLEMLRVDHEAGRPTPMAALEWARLVTELRIRQRRLEEAERVAAATLERAVPVAASIPIDVAALTVSLAKVALERGDADRAAECLARAEPALRRPGYDTRSELAALLETRAELRRREGDRKAARTDLEEALRLRTRDGENGLGAARTLLALAQVESEHCAHAVAMDHARRALRVYSREIGAASAEGRDACEAYGRIRATALKAGLTEADAPSLRGMRLGEALEPDAAETDERVRALLAKVPPLEAARDWEGLLAVADEALALRPGEPRAHAARFRALLGLGRKDDAMAAGDASIAWALTPAALLHSWRAGASVMLRRYDQTIVDATYALLLGDKDPAGFRLRGMARLARGEVELALRNLDETIKADPEDAMAQSLRGAGLWSLDRLDDAATALRVAAAGGKTNTLDTLAKCERALGNVDAALAAANASIEAGTGDLDGYGVRGFIRLDRGEWKAALADFEAWAGDEPPSLYGRILQWICRARLGERGDASAALRAAIDGEKERESLKAVARAILGEGPVPPEDPPAPSDRAGRDRQCVAYFLLGAWREVEGDPLGAKAHYERSLAMDRPSNLEHASAKAALARLRNTVPGFFLRQREGNRLRTFHFLLGTSMASGF